MVRFPRADSNDNTIAVEGERSVVDKIAAAIEDFVKNRASQITESIDVAPEKHRLLIGRGGEIRRNLETRFKVVLDIPRQGQGEAIRISGQPADVERASAHIENLVKAQKSETVDVPRSAHHLISENGSFFRQLRNNHRVMVDHAGQQPPPSPAGPTASRTRTNGGALPLITDDAEAGPEKHSWELVASLASEDDPSYAGTIPWVLRGQPESVEKARGLLQNAIEAAGKHGWTGYLILPDPKAHRLVVGPGGSQVNTIRKETGCKVAVPRGQDKGEAIEIVGTREGVEKAKRMILDVVRSSGGSS